MSERPVSSEEPATEPPGIAALFAQLGSDARAFANAEMRWIKAEAGERARHVVPALILIVSALALGAGALIALLIGLILVIGPMIGTGVAVAIVIVSALLLAALLGWAGSQKIKRAFRPLEDR